ncbi:hypothetical protein N0V88_005152 [Collariella sp. IMI 366227]|nr:hypothetical protein N0V88_005152 [Collariella sp. IMI 366227]
MADIVTSAQHSSKILQEQADRIIVKTAMPPKRRVRATLSPSPAPQSSGGTPAQREALPTKYSTSYGSPMSQLPDRAKVGGGGNTVKALAEVVTKVSKDNIAAEKRRQIRDQARRAARPENPNESSPPPSTIHRSIELAEPNLSGGEVSGGSGSEYEDQNVLPTSRRKSPRKRVRDDEEEEARAEKERKERDARLKAERAAEARKKSAQKKAETKAAAEAAAKEKAEKAEQTRLAKQQWMEEQQRMAEQQRIAEQEGLATRQRLAQQKRLEEQKRLAEQERVAQLTRDEVARAAMPPPPPPPSQRNAPGTNTTPARLTAPADSGSGRPGSSRSFNAEGSVYQGADVRTPTPESAHQFPSPAPPAEPASPPSVLKQPPRRPGRTPNLRKFLGNEDAPALEPADAESSTYAARLRHRLKPAPDEMDTVEEDEEQPLSSVSETVAGDKEAPVPKATRSYIPWSFLKLLSCVLLGLIITSHSLQVVQRTASPDFFEAHRILEWYGWKDWTNNIGQFFPSPVLNTRGVLTDDQYNDLKDYLQTRMTTTEAALDNIKKILPKVVSVQKEKNGRVIIGEEFWQALKDRIHHEQTMLTLDGKSQISDKNWKAIHQRLRDANLAGPHITADNVERIIHAEGPKSWERWARKNEQKVTEILGLNKLKDASKLKPSPSGESVISRQDFLRELNDHLAKHKKQIDTEMDSLRKELHGLVRDFRATAPPVASPSGGGLSKPEITALVKEVVTKEITRRQLSAVTGGFKWGTSRSSLDASLRRVVNHFNPGNGAVVDITATSPTFKTAVYEVGTKEWKKQQREAKFLEEKIQALNPWTDPGHCWCASILSINKNVPKPADVVVRIAHNVIPQYLVLEHIDPSSTNDPLSMPKDIEIWAVFPEKAVRERMWDWMAAQWPEDVKKPGNKKLLEKEKMVKIGEFTYQQRPADEGVYIHKLSDELAGRLKAATDQVLVRALTNYGAKDHTCFYRLRMYGEVVEDAEVGLQSKGWL